MHEFDIIKKYFSKLSSNNKSSLDLNDDVFFNKSKELVISVDTYIEGTHFINFKACFISFIMSLGSSSPICILIICSSLFICVNCLLPSAWCV